MSAPFVNRRVKVTGTSRSELNGQIGLAQSYNANTIRYTVLLDSGMSLALKPVNLIPEGNEDESGRGNFPGMGGMPDMNKALDMLPLWLKEKVMRGQAPDMSDIQRLLPSGVSLGHVGIFVALLMIMTLKIGVLRAFILFTMIGMLVYGGYGAFTRASGGINGLKAAMEAVGRLTLDKLNVSLSPVSTQITVVVAVLAVLYFTLFSGSPSHVAPSHEYYSHTSYLEVMSLEEAYQLGYSDASSGVESDWQRHAPPRRAPPVDYSFASTPRGDMFSNFFSFGNIFTLVILGKQIYGLGAVPGGSWDRDLAVANLMNMGSIQKCFMVLMVLRLFGLSPI